MQFGFITIGVGLAANLFANRSIFLRALNGRAMSRMTADSKHLLPICLLFSLQTGGMFSALKSPGVSRKPPAVA